MALFSIPIPSVHPSGDEIDMGAPPYRGVRIYLLPESVLPSEPTEEPKRISTAQKKSWTAKPPCDALPAHFPVAQTMSVARSTAPSNILW